MKTLIVLSVIVASLLVDAQLPKWISVQRTPTFQSKNSKSIGCRSILPGYYKNIECASNFIVEQLNLKGTPQFSLAQTFRSGYDFPLPSSRDGSWGLTGSYYLGERADIYDNAVAAMFLINAGKMEKAKQICDTFVLMVEFDYASDGRTRSAFSVDNPIDRDYLPGRFITYGTAIVDSSVVTGNLAYMILALTRFYIHTQDYKYLRAALKIGNCIDNNLRYNSPWGGYTGGFTQTKGHDRTITWRSVQHNIDVWAAARMLYGLTKDKMWSNMMQRAQTYVKHSYDSNKGLYYAGSPPICPPQDFLNTNMPITVDTQAMNALSDVDPDIDRKVKSLQYVIQTMVKTEYQVDDVTGKNIDYTGVLFSDQGTNIQLEQTASAAMAFYKIGKQIAATYPSVSAQFLDIASGLVQTLLKNQQYAINGDGQGIVASLTSNGAKVWEGNDYNGTSWTYYPVLHTSASAWTGLALYYIFYDDLYASPYSEYYNKPITMYYGNTMVSTNGEVSAEAPSKVTEDPQTYTLGTAGLVITCLFAGLLIIAFIVMAAMNIKLVRKYYQIVGEGEGRSINATFSPMISPATPTSADSPMSQ